MAHSNDEVDLSGHLHCKQAEKSVADCTSSIVDALLSTLAYDAVSRLFLPLLDHRSTGGQVGGAHTAHKVQHGHTQAFLHQRWSAWQSFAQ